MKQPYVAFNGDLLLVDTSAGSFQITLPSYPTTGTSVSIRERRSSWATNSLIVNPGNMPIEGQTGQISMTGSIKNFDLVYVADTFGWSMVAY